MQPASDSPNASRHAPACRRAERYARTPAPQSPPPRCSAPAPPRLCQKPRLRQKPQRPLTPPPPPVPRHLLVPQLRQKPQRPLTPPASPDAAASPWCRRRPPAPPLQPAKPRRPPRPHPRSLPRSARATAPPPRPRRRSRRGSVRFVAACATCSDEGVPSTTTVSAEPPSDARNAGSASPESRERLHECHALPLRAQHRREPARHRRGARSRTRPLLSGPRSS